MKAENYVAKDKSPTVAAIPKACSDELEAVAFFERTRWGEEPRCAKCGDANVYQMRQRGTGERIPPFKWRCRACNKTYTVRTGTVMEESLIQLRHWCYAFWAACASKKGVSALQIKRQTGLTYKSALFLMHRIRFAMSQTPDAPAKLQGTVEADETYVGGKPRYRGGAPRKMHWDKAPVFAAVARGGEVRAMALTSVNTRTLRRALSETVSPDARLMTDDSKLYKRIGRQFLGGHYSVRHGVGEYVRGEVHSNTVEGFFSLIKRGVYGTFHNVSRKYLGLYVQEFQYRYNTRWIDDGARTLRAMRQGTGKRLYYKEPAATGGINTTRVGTASDKR